MARSLMIVTCLCMLAPLAAAQPRDNGAVLLLGESGIEPELVADLSEVLVTALLQKSSNRYQFQGKESVLNQIESRRTESGQLCLESNDCIRAWAREAGLGLMVFGKVGKAAYGYWLIITKVALTGIPDEVKKIKVEGGVTKLIEDVEASADWILGPDRTFLAVEVNEDGVTLTLDGRDLGVVTRDPVEVTPGQHTVLLRKPDFQDVTQSVDCALGTLCKVAATLEKAVVGIVTPPPTNGTPATEPEPVKAPDEPKKPAKKTVLWRALGYSFTGLALGAAGGAAYFTVMLRKDANDYDARVEELCPDGVCPITRAEFDADPRIRAIQSDGESHARWATVTWVTAGVTGAAALAFFLVDAFIPAPSGDTAMPLLQPWIHPDFAGLSLGLDF